MLLRNPDLASDLRDPGTHVHGYGYARDVGPWTRNCLALLLLLLLMSVKTYFAGMREKRVYHRSHRLLLRHLDLLWLLLLGLLLLQSGLLLVGLLLLSLSGLLLLLLLLLLGLHLRRVLSGHLLLPMRQRVLPRQLFVPSSRQYKLLLILVLPLRLDAAQLNRREDLHLLNWFVRGMHVGGPFGCACCLLLLCGRGRLGVRVLLLDRLPYGVEHKSVSPATFAFACASDTGTRAADADARETLHATRSHLQRRRRRRACYWDRRGGQVGDCDEGLGNVMKGR